MSTNHAIVVNVAKNTPLTIVYNTFYSSPHCLIKIRLSFDILDCRFDLLFLKELHLLLIQSGKRPSGKIG